VQSLAKIHRYQFEKNAATRINPHFVGAFFQKIYLGAVFNKIVSVRIFGKKALVDNQSKTGK